MAALVQSHFTYDFYTKNKMWCKLNFTFISLIFIDDCHIILHMAWQHCCHAICKKWDNLMSSYKTTTKGFFNQVWIMNEESLVKQAVVRDCVWGFDKWGGPHHGSICHNWDWVRFWFPGCIFHRPRVDLTRNLWAHNPNLLIIHIAVTQTIMIWLGHNFTHVTATE